MSDGPTSFAQFEQRKQDHIDLALKDCNQASGLSGFADIQLPHEALPELDFAEVSIESQRLGKAVPSPFIVSSMTAGHPGGVNINQRLMQACNETGWAMGVGSQRRELSDKQAAIEWKNLRADSPKVDLFGNLGISQLIISGTNEVERLVDALEATAMQIHLNPLQECIQPEGTPQFKGGYQALERLCRELSVPVVVKETGSGISAKTQQRLFDCGVSAIDVSGLGGTHWGRIEGGRAANNSVHAKTATSFKSWGISTVDALAQASKLRGTHELWGSGGIRSGLDAAKAIYLGASTIGVAKPLLEAALSSIDALINEMHCFDYELRVALFCSGNANVSQLQETFHALS